MTNEEAIEIISNALQSDESKYTDRIDKALAVVQRVLEQQPCEDCISRQAALDAFGLSEKTRKYGGDHSGYDTVMKYEIQDIIEDLPSVTPQQKTGRWIKTPEAVMGEGYMWYCNKCKHRVYQDSSRPYPSEKFCPKCGANMEVEE